MDPDPESDSLLLIRIQGGHFNADPCRSGYGSGSETLLPVHRLKSKYRYWRMLIPFPSPCSLSLLNNPIREKFAANFPLRDFLRKHCLYSGAGLDTVKDK